MILNSIVLFLLAYTVSGKHVISSNNDYPSLKFPTTYTVEATKLYISSGWTEQLKYWRSDLNEYTRLDFNSGTVIKINKPPIKRGYGWKYEIHPETTEEETNKKVCCKERGTSDVQIEPENFLPDVDDFNNADGKDSIKGVECMKFPGKYSDVDETLWAFYNQTAEHWVPVRYEKRYLDSIHGYISDHVVFDFFNFETKVDQDVFSVYDLIGKRTLRPPDDSCELLYNYDDDDAPVKSETDYLSMKKGLKKEFEEVFATYKTQFKKKYAHHDEHEKRKGIFYKNWRLVNDTNSKNLGYRLALNKMSDRTNKELKGYKGLRRDKPKSFGNIRFPYSQEEIRKMSETLPLEYDLRLEGVVGPVLSQEDCGSCWTFGTTAAVEGAVARSNGGQLIALSNQAILDCSWGYGNGGCNGGSDSSAYKWIMRHGLPTQEEYGQYLNEDGYCNIENMTTTYKIRGWVDVTPYSEQALKIALVNHGPLSVSLSVSSAVQYYEGGILYDPECSSTNLDHEVTLVGYGVKDGESFWIIRNSWGRFWGIDGYMHISTRNNNCGIMTEPTYVVV